MAKIYYDRDANLDVYKDRTIAIIGYGIQGRGQALNLRDSGLNVIIAELPESPNYETAKADGFKPIKAKDAAKKADVIMILTQDHVQASIYRKSLKRYLTKGKSIYVEGRLQTRQWEDNNGVTKFTTEIVVRDMLMLGGTGERGDGGYGPPPPEEPPAFIQNQSETTEDDIPF